MPEKISICPNCGSDLLIIYLTKPTKTVHCTKCKYKGLPLKIEKTRHEKVKKLLTGSKLENNLVGLILAKIRRD